MKKFICILVFAMSLSESIFSMDDCVDLGKEKSEIDKLLPLIIELAESENPKEILEKLDWDLESLEYLKNQLAYNARFYLNYARIYLANLKRQITICKTWQHLKWNRAQAEYCTDDKKYRFEFNSSYSEYAYCPIKVISNQTDEQFNLIRHIFIVSDIIYYEDVEYLISSNCNATAIWDLKNHEKPLLFAERSALAFRLSSCHRFLIYENEEVVDLKTLFAIEELIKFKKAQKNFEQKKFTSMIYAFSLMKYKQKSKSK